MLIRLPNTAHGTGTPLVLRIPRRAERLDILVRSTGTARFSKVREGPRSRQIRTGTAISKRHSGGPDEGLAWEVAYSLRIGAVFADCGVKAARFAEYRNSSLS